MAPWTPGQDCHHPVMLFGHPGFLWSFFYLPVPFLGDLDICLPGGILAASLQQVKEYYMKGFNDFIWTLQGWEFGTWFKYCNLQVNLEIFGISNILPEPILARFHVYLKDCLYHICRDLILPWLQGVQYKAPPNHIAPGFQLTQTNVCDSDCFPAWIKNTMYLN